VPWCGTGISMTQRVGRALCPPPRVRRQRKDELRPKPSRHNPVNSGATVGGTAGVIMSGFVIGNTPTLEGR